MCLSNTNTDAWDAHTDAYTYGDADSYTESDTEAPAHTVSSANSSVRR